MGGACLRGHSHHRPAGGSGRPAARGRRQGHLAYEPDPAGAYPRPQLLCVGHHTNALRYGNGQEQPDALADPHALSVYVRVALGDRGDQRLGDSVPFADRHGDAITIAER